MTTEQAAHLIDLAALLLSVNVLALGLGLFAFGVWQVSR